MIKKTPIEPGQEPEGARKRLTELRHALLKLHKALVDSEGVGYEKTIGKIKSPNHFLQLLTGDPWFAWLHPLSQLIVAMDEVAGRGRTVDLAKVDALVRESDLLLVVSETSEGFSGHYHEALQRDPDVVLAHAEVVKLRGPRKS